MADMYASLVYGTVGEWMDGMECIIEYRSRPFLEEDKYAMLQQCTSIHGCCCCPVKQSWQLAVGSVRHGSNNKPAIDAPNKISSPLPASLLFPLQHGHDRGMLVLGLQLHFTYLARYHVTWRSPHEYLHRGIFAFSFPKHPPHTASQQHMAVNQIHATSGSFPAISPQHYA
jgi:hypothetical protein